MNRREFGKQSAGMVAVAGGLAATGCVKHPLPPLEPKIGDKVRCSRICAGDNTPVTLEPCVSEIRMIERLEFAKCTRVRYACLLPVSAGFSGVSECGYCTREEIEVIA